MTATDASPGLAVLGTAIAAVVTEAGTEASDAVEGEPLSKSVSHYVLVCFSCSVLYSAARGLVSVGSIKPPHSTP